MTNPTPPPPKPIVRLVNPYKYVPHSEGERIQMDISKEDFNYLFRGVLAGTRGAQSAIIGTFIQKLIHELKHSEPAFEPYWDDEHPDRIAAILARINFAPVLAGCTTPGSAGCAPARDERDGTKRVRAGNKGGKNKPADVSSKATGRVRRNSKETKKEEDGGHQ